MFVRKIYSCWYVLIRRLKVPSGHNYHSPCAQVICGKRWRTTALTWMLWAPSLTRPSDYQTVTWELPTTLPHPLVWTCRYLTYRSQASTLPTHPKTLWQRSIWIHQSTTSQSPCFKGAKVKEKKSLTLGEKNLLSGVRKSLVYALVLYVHISKLRCPHTALRLSCGMRLMCIHELLCTTPPPQFPVVLICFTHRGTFRMLSKISISMSISN